MRTDESLPIALVVAPRWLPIFGSLLSQGFTMAVQTGVSLRDVLCQQLGIEKDYLENRIKTVFLDSRAVDDVNRAVVENGAAVAISAAMPGLVGAVMRRGGLYADFRNSISYRAKDQKSAVKPGIIRVKLFNLVAKELGPRFLAQGIQIESRAWRAFLSGQPEDFKRGIVSARVDQRPIDPAELFTRQWPDGYVHLIVAVQ